MTLHPLQITIDTREQTPWHFDPQDAVCVRGTLKTGDYALTGDDGFAIERKSLDDFLGTISSGWERFKKELARARAAGFVMPIIVEGDADDMLWTAADGVLVPPCNNHPGVPAGLALQRIGEIWSLGGAVIPMKTVANSAAVAYSILLERRRTLEDAARQNSFNDSRHG